MSQCTQFPPPTHGGSAPPALAAIPDSLVDELIVHGSPAECRAKIQRYFDNGVTTTSLRLPLVHTAMSAATPAYRRMPGLSVRGAARLVCRAIVDRPRVISPWWVRLAGLAMEAAPGLADRAMTAFARRERR